MNAHARLAFALAALSALAAAAAAPAEPPAQLDPVEVTAEQRLEAAFRTVQVGLERSRSDRAEDADLIVCIRQTPTGTHRPVIDCATNRKWAQLRARSLAGGLSGLEANGGPGGSATAQMMAQATGASIGHTGLNATGAYGDNGAAKRDDDKVVTMSASDYEKLERRFGALPQAQRAAARGD